MALREQETLCGSSSTSPEVRKSSSKVVDSLVLLDEYWFFHNSLTSKKPRAFRASFPMSSCKSNLDEEISTSQLMAAKTAMKTPSRSDRIAAQMLLRIPSMSSPCDAREELGDSSPTSEEAYMAAIKVRSSADRKIASSTLIKTPSLPAPTELNISTLRHSCSSLDYHGHQSAPKSTRHNSGMARLRPPKDFSKGEGSNRWCEKPTNMIHEADYRKLFQEKKWKSFSHLESIEVQGFKDLGFKFDQEELNATLANVIPGLREKRPSTAGSDERRRPASRPYLSEAWFVQMSAPPLVLKRASKSSAADMKEQLRFWARAVASNVRQES